LLPQETFINFFPVFFTFFSSKFLITIAQKKISKGLNFIEKTPLVFEKGFSLFDLVKKLTSTQFMNLIGQPYRSGLDNIFSNRERLSYEVLQSTSLEACDSQTLII